MSGDRWPRAVASHLWTFLISALGWILIASWASLMPRRRDLMSVIGRDEGKYVDNAKYFYLQAAPLLAPSVRTVFITERQNVADMLLGTPYEAMVYPSARAVWFLLRSGTVVVDSIEWPRRLRRFWVVRAKLVQLWHGVGFKRIELDKWQNEVSANGALSSPCVLAMRKAMHKFTGRLVRYDVVNTTSTFYRDNVFTHAFLSRHFLVAGYPRNTFGKLDDMANMLAWRNVDASIVKLLPQWLEAKRRIVLVAPTFRDSRATPMGLVPDIVSLLDDYCETHGVELVFKFHPFERQADQVRGRHLHLCSPDSDLYPLMPVSSALVTDYSSIYMDYLLLDKPVLFLVPDVDQYIREDRQLQFDFDDMTPGPKLSSWHELTNELSHQWDHDDYLQARAELKRKAFDDLPQHDAVPKLINFMRSQSWLPGARS
jgi:CDP-glycerol glycerophosphotransferase (TagB/SpsB family)